MPPGLGQGSVPSAIPFVALRFPKGTDFSSAPHRKVKYYKLPLELLEETTINISISYKYNAKISKKNLNSDSSLINWALNKCLGILLNLQLALSYLILSQSCCRSAIILTLWMRKPRISKDKWQSHSRCQSQDTNLGMWWTIDTDWKSESESRSVLSDSLWPHGLYGPWNSPGQNTGVGSLSLLQRLFPTQGSNPVLLHFRWILYQLSYD